MRRLTVSSRGLTISNSSRACTRSSMLFVVSSAIAIFSFMIRLSLLPRMWSSISLVRSDRFSAVGAASDGAKA